MRRHPHRRMPPSLAYVSGLCSTGKRSYFTRAGAKVLARILKAEGDKGVRPYRCPECDHFHAGHLPTDVRSGRRTADEIYRPASS